MFLEAYLQEAIFEVELMSKKKLYSRHRARKTAQIGLSVYYLTRYFPILGSGP